MDVVFMLFVFLVFFFFLGFTIPIYALMTKYKTLSSLNEIFRFILAGLFSFLFLFLISKVKINTDYSYPVYLILWTVLHFFSIKYLTAIPIEAEVKTKNILLNVKQTLFKKSNPSIFALIVVVIFATLLSMLFLTNGV